MQSTIHAFTVVGLLIALSTAARSAEIELALQTRDQAGAKQVEPARIDSQRIGVVVVDMWNYHWCKTATMRVGELVPRMNHVLDACRELGMTVMLCPSDVVDNYVGWPQREIIFAMPKHQLPMLKAIECPEPPNAGGCACGRERCVVNYGWDGMHPDLRIADADLMPDTLEDVYSICRERKLTHLIYMGVHTQVCLLGKPMGLRNLKAAGLNCILARDLTDAHPGYDLATGLTPDSHTAEVVAHFEKYLAPTVNMKEELQKLGRWDKDWIVDSVRMTPWGTTMRPHVFSDDVVVTLSTPWQPEAAIHYTLDGSEPTSASLAYEAPLKLLDTTRIRAAAFDGQQRVALLSEGYFARLGPVPPLPDIVLSDLKPVRVVGPSHTYGDKPRFSPHSQPPQTDVSNEGRPLKLRGVEYERGLGVHANCQIMYELDPRYERFVGLAGTDERILETANGSNAARYPSVIFKVFIDGKPVAASPVMRVSEQPWRFDVPIPAGAKRISLVTTDAGDGNKEDLANWVNAGFVLRK